MTTPSAPARDLAYLRLLIGQMVRDGQALIDAITEDGRETAAYCQALGTFGEGVHQYVVFWEGITVEERLEDIGPWGEQ